MKVHFKRHGSGDWLELQGMKAPYYIEIMGNKLSIQKIIDNFRESEKIININVTDWDALENKISLYTGKNINLGRFIESYHIPQREHPEDRDFINGRDITGKTTAEVIKKTGIKLDEYFNDWKLPESVYKSLEQPNEKILSMKFKELFQLIHWNCHKREFAEKYHNEITL